MKKITLLLAFALVITFVKAQTAEEIIENYIENIGGVDAWSKLKGIKMNSKVNTPMGEIPLTIISLKSGKQIVKLELQGKEIVQMAFDGETAWGHNQMNMQAEKSDSETTENLKREAKDFPDPFFKYKEKGYSIELMENETFEGTECFKIKLTKTPSLSEGKEVENIVYYLFDTENFVPIVVETELKSGPGKGYIAQTIFSDYQEVDGLYFAFSMTQGVKGQAGQAIIFESIEINPVVDDSIFAFPGKK